MKKLFSLLIIVSTILVSCKKESVEPDAPVNNISNSMSLTDSVKSELFGKTFYVVFDEIFDNSNVTFVDTAVGNKRMYDIWTVDSLGNCMVTPYTYNCHSNYKYDSTNFNFTLNQFTNTVYFTISVHGDTIDIPYNNPIDWRRTGGSNYGINKLKYKFIDPSGIGSSCFETFSLNSFNIVSRYSIK